MLLKTLNRYLIICTIGYFFLSTSVSGQRRNEDLRNRQVAVKFMSYLEQKKPDSAILLLDSKKIVIDAAFKKKLKDAIKEIDVLAKKMELLIMVVGEKKQLYTCRYISSQEKYAEFYEVDIYFSDDSGNKISKLIFFDRKVLLKEQIRREKAASTPPPIPPPDIQF